MTFPAQPRDQQSDKQHDQQHDQQHEPGGGPDAQRSDGSRLLVRAPAGVGEIAPGTDLASLLLEVAADLGDGDIVCVTSKVVSKAEGRLRSIPREEAVEQETVRVLARRGQTRIVRNRLGLTMAAAGVDASNVPVGQVLLLPEDPDASARRIRAAVAEATGRNVAVVVTDTAGRTWRDGQTDIAVGAAGLRVLDDHAGRFDEYGNPLSVTAPAVADELASAAELAQHKLGGRPFAIISGRPDLVLPAGEDGDGGAGLIRPDGADLFGYGAREAVVRALAGVLGGEDADPVPFGTPASGDELCRALTRILGPDAVSGPPEGLPGDVPGTQVLLPIPDAADAATLHLVVSCTALAHGWAVDRMPGTLRLRPADLGSSEG